MWFTRFTIIQAFQPPGTEVISHVSIFSTHFTDRLIIAWISFIFTSHIIEASNFRISFFNMGWSRAARRAGIRNPCAFQQQFLQKPQRHVQCCRAVFSSDAAGSGSSGSAEKPKPKQECTACKPATKKIQLACPWHNEEHRKTMHSVQTTLPFASRFLDEMGLRTVPPKNFAEAVNEAFDQMDSDHDDHITRSELKGILHDRIYHCSPDCAADLDKELTALGAGNPDQKISRAEFQRVVSDMSEKLDERVWPVTMLSGVGGLCFAMSGTLTPVLSQELGFSAATFGGIIAMMPLVRLPIHSCLLFSSFVRFLPAATIILNLKTLFWFEVRVASTIPTTIAAETMGRKPLMTGGCGIITVGFVMNAWITTPLQFLVARIVSGVGTSALSVGQQNYIADISTSKNRARSYSPGNTASSAGFAVGPTLAGLLSDAIGARPSFLVLSGGMTVVTALSQYLLPETLRKPDKSVIRATGKESKGLAIETFNRWKELLKDRGLRHMVLANCGMNATSITARYVVLPMTALNHWDFSASQLGILLGSMSLIQALAQFPGAYISDRFGRMAVFAPGMAVRSALGDSGKRHFPTWF